jgi:hypothetical protein
MDAAASNWRYLNVAVQEIAPLQLTLPPNEIQAK